MKYHASSIAALALSLGTSVGLTGCWRAPAQPPPAGPPSVTVSLPIQRQVTDYENFPGQLAAIDSVEIRARVGGYLQKINFKEGVEVEQNQVMYVIDPRPYQAAVDQAEAQVKLQEANLRYQEEVFKRNQRLLDKGQAVDVETVQQSLAQRDSTRASLQAAQANLKQARLNLEWTNVTAPISGRVGRTLLTLGNLVVADQTLLTTIVSLDPIYAYFDVDERTAQRVQELIRQGRFQSVRFGGRPPVLLGLAAEQGFPHEGYVDFVNNQVTLGTGTLQVRAVFANPKPKVGDRILIPGFFARIRVPIGPPYPAILVNQRAIGTDQNLRFVYVVDESNRVARHDVELGSEQDGLQVILKGLQPNERVIVEGIQRVRPGMEVNPNLVPMPELGPAATSPPVRIPPLPPKANPPASTKTNPPTAPTNNSPAAPAKANPAAPAKTNSTPPTKTNPQAPPK